MKSTTSRSDLPAENCSRIWLRRSTASGAFESAMVWFWHTRQRSSCARLVTRRSRPASCASAQPSHKKTARLAARIELPHERLHFVAHHVGAERPDVLVANHALAIDDVGLRHAVDAIVDADASVAVEGDELVGVAVALEPGQCVIARVLVVQADERRDP